MKLIKYIIIKTPFIGETVYNISKKLYEILRQSINRRKILKEAKKEFTGSSLDVSFRNGFLIFHNKNNTLINRGDIYEQEVQLALITLFNIDKIRNEKTVFADIGANIGLHTLFIKKLFPRDEIIAFEPSPISYNYLELTIKYNKFTNIRLEKVALSDENSISEFYSWGEESSADSLKDTKRVTGVNPNIIKVPTVKLDSVDNLPNISVIKMDTEGAELSILRGAYNSIFKFKPFIILEFHIINKNAFNVETNHIFEFLDTINYSILTITFELLTKVKFNICQEKYIEDYIMLPNSFLKQ